MLTGVMCFSFTLLFISCMDLTSGKKYLKDETVVAGIIYSSKSINKDSPIYLGKTKDIDNLYLEDMVLSSILVYIVDIETEKRQYLTYYDNISDSLYQQPVLKVGYYDATQTFNIVSGQTYRLIAKTGVDSVWAETTVPLDINILPNNGFSFDVNIDPPSIAYHQIDNFNPLGIQLKEHKSSTIIIEIYCMEEWTDAYFVLSNEQFETPKSAVDYENIISGYPRKKVIIQQVNVDDINSKSTINIFLAQTDFTFFGRYRVSISLVDDNYHNFLCNKLSYLNGGIIGGLGYFGSATQKIIYTTITRE